MIDPKEIFVEYELGSESGTYVNKEPVKEKPPEKPQENKQPKIDILISKLSSLEISNRCSSIDSVSKILTVRDTKLLIPAKSKS